MGDTEKKHPPHFFKYCNAMVAKLILKNRRVRWNSPLNFNDPFDCYFGMDPKFDFQEVGKKHMARFVELVTQKEEPKLDLSSPSARFVLMIRGLCKQHTQEEVSRLLDGAFDEYSKCFEHLGGTERERWLREMASYRLFCVCEINDDIPMWGYYCDNHRGAVLQFECIADLDVPLLVAQRVRYSEEAPSMATEDEWLESCLGLRPRMDGKEVWTRMVTTKASAWSHEKEWRVVSTKRSDETHGYDDALFHAQEVSKVFLGCRMLESDRTELLELLSGQFAHVEAYQATQHPKKYCLQFERIK